MGQTGVKVAHEGTQGASAGFLAAAAIALAGQPRGHPDRRKDDSGSRG